MDKYKTADGLLHNLTCRKTAHYPRNGYWIIFEAIDGKGISISSCIWNVDLSASHSRALMSTRRHFANDLIMPCEECFNYGGKLG